MIATFIVAEAYDSLQGDSDKFEYWEWVDLYMGPQSVHDKRSVGMGQLTQVEVAQYRRNNRLIDNDPHLASMSNEALVRNNEGNIYLMANKIRSLINSAPYVSTAVANDMRHDNIDCKRDYSKPAREWSQMQIHWFAMAYNDNNWETTSNTDPYATTIYNVWLYIGNNSSE